MVQAGGPQTKKLQDKPSLLSSLGRLALGRVEALGVAQIRRLEGAGEKTA